jgi:hypothetical protein
MASNKVNIPARRVFMGKPPMEISKPYLVKGVSKSVSALCRELFLGCGYVTPHYYLRDSCFPRKFSVPIRVHPRRSAVSFFLLSGSGFTNLVVFLRASVVASGF